MCPWGEASILNLDLEDPILFKALKAFKNLRVKLGGSLQDQIYYKVGNPPKCPKLKFDQDAMFRFTEGCLSMCRWDELNDFFKETGAVLTFGLKALNGRTRANAQANALFVGDWDLTNARDLINYTVSRGYNGDSWELGNELSGSGIAASVHADQYAKDLIALRIVLNELYQNANMRPKILAPGGFYDQQWFAEMLQASGPGVRDGVTHPIYNLGAGVDPNLIYEMQDPYYLRGVASSLQR